MTKEDVGNLWGEFTWDFGQCFFIETSYGNFIWSDPGYNGNNTITKTELSYKQWLGDLPYGRSKGKYYIFSYCGRSFTYVE